MTGKYNLYLVTDSGLVPEGLTLYDQVKASLEGGATMVQLREKEADTQAFVALATEIHALTRKYDVPLIINDRVDVALAIDAEGVHVGQDDLDVQTVRKLLGPSKIVGLSVNSVAEAERAVKCDIDYVGIGAVYGTQTKNLKKLPIGISGVRRILRAMEQRPTLEAVAIGGINARNADKVMRLSRTESSCLQGVAVVSCIIGAKDAKAATEELKAVINGEPVWHRSVSEKGISSLEQLLTESPTILTKVRDISPLVHHITNNVVKNISANITIAAGASPAMSETKQEFADFAAVPNCGLLLNMGTSTPEAIQLFEHAIACYNQHGRGIVVDPVAAGATTYRRDAIKRILDFGSIDVVKGNQGEIYAAANVEGGKMKGVDSVGSATQEARLAACEKLARDNHTVAVMTGVQDIVVEGYGSGRRAVVSNGHHFLGEITGSGCMLGSLIACFTSVHTENVFDAALTALLLYTIAAERAGARSDVRGPGTFMPALIDEVYLISTENKAGNHDWIQAARVEFV